MKPNKAADPARKPAGGTPLFAQSGAFWLGAYMVAEGPMLLGISVLDPALRERLFEAAFGNAVALIGVLLAAVVPGLLVGMLAHRLGFGD